MFRFLFVLLLLVSPLQAQSVLYKTIFLSESEEVIESVTVGDTYYAVLLVQDLRKPETGLYTPSYYNWQTGRWVYGAEREIGRGVQAVACNIQYDQTLSQVQTSGVGTLASAVKINDFYPNGRALTRSYNKFYVRGFQHLGEGPGPDLIEFCRIKLKATKAGEQKFTPYFRGLSYPIDWTIVQENHITGAPSHYIQPTDIKVESAILTIKEPVRAALEEDNKQ